MTYSMYPGPLPGTQPAMDTAPNLSYIGNYDMGIAQLDEAIILEDLMIRQACAESNGLAHFQYTTSPYTHSSGISYGHTTMGPTPTPMNDVQDALCQQSTISPNGIPTPPTRSYALNSPVASGSHNIPLFSSLVIPASAVAPMQQHTAPPPALHDEVDDRTDISPRSKYRSIPRSRHCSRQDSRPSSTPDRTDSKTQDKTPAKPRSMSEQPVATFAPAVPAVSSPNSIANRRTLRTANRKRKSIANAGAADEPVPGEAQPVLSRSPQEQDTKGHGQEETTARARHNGVEKEYRNRLNCQFRLLLGDLDRYSRHGDGQRDRDLSKAEVLELARSRIQVLEKETDELHEENELLREQHATIVGAIKQSQAAVDC